VTRYSLDMRNTFLPTLFLSCLCISVVACSGECSAPTAGSATADAAAASNATATPVSMSIVVKGMHCEGCEGAICDRVGKIAGVTSVKASHVDERVNVTAPEESRADVIAAIKKLGYTIEE